jgi:hypothetical protein
MIQWTRNIRSQVGAQHGHGLCRVKHAPLQTSQIARDAAQAKQELRPKGRHLYDVAGESACVHATANTESLAHANSAGSRRSRTLAMNG